MAAQYTQLSEVVKSMRTFAPFSIEWVGADAKRKKAGKWHKLDKAVLSGPANMTRRGAPGRETKSEFVSKNPAAMENDTVNIINLTNRDLVKVHLRLIKHFNGRTVIY